MDSDESKQFSLTKDLTLMPQRSALEVGFGIDCLAVSVFFKLFSLQASVTVKNRGGAISNDRMVAPSHFGC